ncbi:carbohydrate-binding protein [Larkinella rosea]|uniref:Carbohydrate-binding protein n=1 Tax=Larkinella rosea TaxID=2025312 RepID=A0A3P1BJW6_9BACT|nr:carbohydrate-binding protein [Larkinella rosea]RRB01246.1 carbohydrate-binding protein [Larkinella rosea]
MKQKLLLCYLLIACVISSIAAIAPLEREAAMNGNSMFMTSRKVHYYGIALNALTNFKPLPGKIEAESYDAMSGVSTENTSDVGGGLNVGWIDVNDWMDYNVNVPTTGIYTLKFRLATGQPDGKLELRSATGAVLGTLNVPQSGGWQGWTTVNMTAALTAGDQIVRVFAKQGAWNFNWFEVVAARTVPAKIEAETFDTSGDVKTETTSDTGGGLDVGWIDDGDWMDYNLKVGWTGSYQFNFRVARSYGGNGTIQIKNAIGTVLSTITVAPTGGWQTWATVSGTLNLNAGDQVVRIHALSGGWNFNWFQVVSLTPPPVQSVISFAALPTKTVGDAPFNLVASSNNTQTPITFGSSNPAVVSVSNSTGSWKATVVSAGTANITASQAGNGSYLAAANVVQSQLVQAAPVTPPPSSLGTKITIDPKRWYQLNNITYGMDGLFDGVTNVVVNTGYGKILENFDAYYPLQAGEQMTLKGVKFYDGEGVMSDKPMTLSVITDQWQRIPIATFTGQEYNNWVGPDPNRQASGDAKFLLNTTITNARYLVINAWWGYPTEIELYGSYTPPTNPVTPAPLKSIKLKDVMHVNAFEWDVEDAQTSLVDESKMTALKTFSGIRHYMDWEKLESTEGGYTFNPTHSGSWNYDLLYERLKAEGVEVLACLKTIPPWMQATYPAGDRDSENVPVRFGKDFSDPLSYIEQAKVAFQYIGRYGYNPNVNPALMKVNTAQRWNGDPINTVKIGLGYIKYIECDNERDKWWKGRKGYQTAYEYAANLSAFYDGHKNTMGPAVGVKNADPNVKVVMGGLAGATTGADYVRAMVEWCRQNRGYKADGSVNLCWDVINYHLYSDNANSLQSGTSTRGAAPEVAITAEVAKGYVQMAHQYVKDMPVWMSEAGYDVNQGSPLKAIAIGSKTVLQTQADWILRTSLLYARAGVEKVFLYQVYDDYALSPGQFASMGLINTDKTRKPAGDFIYQTKKAFGDFVFKQTLSTNPIVDRYELNGKSAYMLVVPDEVGRTAAYTLDLGTATQAKIYTPKAGSNAMDMQLVNTTQGKIAITVTETPVFVTASDVVVNNSASARMGIDKNLGSAESIRLNNAIKVYPNPTVDYISIDLENESDSKLEVKLFSAALGTLHKEINIDKQAAAFSGKIDVSSLPTGVYILEIKQGDDRAFRKILKSK